MKTRLSGVLDRIREKKEQEREKNEREWANNIKEAYRNYFENIWSNYKFKLTRHKITEDSQDMFSAFYEFEAIDGTDVGISVFIDADETGITFTLSPYDYKNTDLDVPFTYDTGVFEAVFGFPDTELFQQDDYDKILKTLEKLTGNPPLVKQFKEDLDAFLEDNYDKISKVVGE